MTALTKIINNNKQLKNQINIKDICDEYNIAFINNINNLIKY